MRHAWHRQGSFGLAALALLLAACAPAPQRPPQPPQSQSLQAAPTPPPVAAPEAAPARAPAPISPWPRLREHFAMQRCDYRPQVQHWARAYTRSPRHFLARWTDALPLLDWVTEQIEQRGLPAEFAMLPFVESDYRPLPARGKGSAGMWQIIPATARANGLHVERDYDGRLDLVDSTRVALDLIAHYYKEFADWRLADLAFNAGEFRVKRALGERDARELSAAQLGKLPLRRVSHDHLDRLQALACIIEDPSRYGVTLPEATTDTRLTVVDLENGMDLRLASRLTGLPLDKLRSWNAAYLDDRMPESAPRRLLIPHARIDSFRHAAASVPMAYWNDWHEQAAGRSGQLDTWASASGIPPEALAAANAMPVGGHVTHTTRLLLPGREPRLAATPRVRTAAAAVHVIAAGDTLGSIARRHGLSLRALRALNPQATGKLRIGSRLRLQPDES